MLQNQRSAGNFGRNPTMPKILFTTTIALSVRGGLLPLARHFRSLGWKVDAMAQGVSQCSQCLENFDQVHEINFSRNPLAIRNMLTIPSEIKRIVEKNNYDLVHVHTPVAAFVLRYALRNWRRSGGKILYTAHGFHFHPHGSWLNNHIFSTLEKIAGNWTDHLIVINQTDHDAARKLGLVPENRLHYIPGIGVDLQKISSISITDTDIHSLQKELGINSDTPLFVMAAEFRRIKHQHQVVDALAEMKNKNAHVAFAGNGALIQKIKDQAIQKNIADRVHFLGFRSDIPQLFHASRAVILCSQFEGLPLSVIEALAMGIPVVGTSVRGTRDLLQDDIGFLVPPTDSATLANTLDWIIDHPQQAAEKGKRAIETVTQYDVKNIVEHHDRLYREVTAA